MKSFSRSRGLRQSILNGRLIWSTIGRTKSEARFPKPSRKTASLLPGCTNSPKDRHVLAAAIKSHAELIVTSNLRDFPPGSLATWDIRAVDPASFLINLYTIEPGAVVARLERIARRRGLQPEDVLARVGRSVPAFSEHVSQELGWELPGPSGDLS